MQNHDAFVDETDHKGIENSHTKEGPTQEPDGQKAGDVFDNLDALRVTQNYDGNVEKILTTVPVRKPSREWFIRTHPGDDYRLTTAALEIKDGEDRGVYLVDPAIRDALGGEEPFGV
jgi:hypothetical protein